MFWYYFHYYYFLLFELLLFQKLLLITSSIYLSRNNTRQCNNSHFQSPISISHHIQYLYKCPKEKIKHFWTWHIKIQLGRVFSRLLYSGLASYCKPCPNFQIFCPLSTFLCPFSEKLHPCFYFLEIDPVSFKNKFFYLKKIHLRK